MSFTCESHGFSPRNVTLKWFRNGNELAATQTTVDPEGDSASYRVSSTTTLVLAPGDVRSQVICEVAHVTLQGGPPLRGIASLSDALRGTCLSPTAQAQVWPPSLPSLPYSAPSLPHPRNLTPDRPSQSPGTQGHHHLLLF